jgi:hypothetical protein
LQEEDDAGGAQSDEKLGKQGASAPLGQPSPIEAAIALVEAV